MRWARYAGPPLRGISGTGEALHNGDRVRVVQVIQYEEAPQHSVALVDLPSPDREYGWTYTFWRVHPGLLVMLDQQDDAGA